MNIICWVLEITVVSQNMAAAIMGLMIDGRKQALMKQSYK